MTEENKITPESLFEKLRKTVIGQEQYLKDLCTAAWLHNLRYQHFNRTGEEINRPKQNILCLGPSGTGKTLAVQTIGKLLKLPVLIEDASSLRGAGWKGTNVSSIIARAIASAKDNADAAYSIVCLDEIDKVFKSRVSESSFLPLDNLLTFLCGGVVTHTENGNHSISLDTSNMFIVCLGAFDGLEEIIQKRICGKNSIGFSAKKHIEPEKDLLQYLTEDDLHEYGIPTEFMGRISLITQTTPFTVDDYRRILTESEASPVRQFDNLLYKSYGVHVSISDAAIGHIAKQAHESKTGARMLARTVTETLHPAIYDLGSDDSISAITLDLDPEGLFIKQEHNGRPNSQGQSDIYRLCDIEFDILDSVPFVCIRKRSDIWLYAETIKQSARQAATFQPECASAAVCILAAAICS